jgi:hypothetical protein
LYSDKTYDLHHEVKDAAGNSDETHTKITVDNFQPFISKFDVKNGATSVFSLARIQNDGTSSINDGKVSIGKTDGD